MSEDAAAVQREVRQCREAVLGGRGPGASNAERAVHPSDRILLGALPAAVERELAALQTIAARGTDPERAGRIAAALLRLRRTGTF